MSGYLLAVRGRPGTRAEARARRAPVGAVARVLGSAPLLLATALALCGWVVFGFVSGFASWWQLVALLLVAGFAVSLAFVQQVAEQRRSPPPALPGSESPVADSSAQAAGAGGASERRLARARCDADGLAGRPEAGEARRPPRD